MLNHRLSSASHHVYKEHGNMNAEHENEDGIREVNRELGATNHHNRLRLGTLTPYFINHFSFGSN